MRTIHVAESGIKAAREAVRRSTLQENPEVERVVREIVAEVRSRGDEALLELGRRFDSPSLTSLEVGAAEMDSAGHQLDPACRAAIEAAAANITAFHDKQVRKNWLDEREGKTTGQLIQPLERVGLYVPGGTAVYPSSVLMTAVPARVAGVRELVMCTPCRKDCTVNPMVLFAARTAGVGRIFKAGGAQAVAAMALGTETVPAVDKVVGPGNVYVNVAKRQLWGQVDIDMLAGPSEVCVLADDGANPVYAAADMLTQAEHDPDCAAFLVTPSAELADCVSAEIERQIERLPRKEILRRALSQNGAIIVTETLDQAIEVANACAPEHLALMIRDPFSALERIKNAGAILIGDFAPQTLGDYLAGPSHTLPTSGTARFSSPLNVDTFMKKTSVIAYTREALKQSSTHLLTFARAEGFEAHAAAVEARFREGA